MRQKTLISGQQVPMLGLGTWALAGSACTKVVRAALDQGYRHLDTAEMYGNESAIGKAIAGFERDKLFITSKAWPDHFAYDALIAACEGSLRQLGTDYLDLYLLHWPKRGADYRRTFEALKALQQAGKVRAVGVSNFTIRLLEEALQIGQALELQIAMNQVEFHPGLYQKALVEFCRERKIAVTGYSPLGKKTILEQDEIQRIAVKHKKTAAQICLCWLIEKDVIAIPKASSKDHLAQNLNIFDFQLDEWDVADLDVLGNSQRLVNPDFAEFEE